MTDRRSLTRGLVLIAGAFVLLVTVLGGRPASADGTSFVPTGNLSIARRSHTATLLADGKVLLVGGWSGSQWLASADLYNPASGTFSPTGSMNTAQYGHAATRLANGKVLITGGYQFQYLSSAELYNPATGTFSPTGSMSASRYVHSATLLPSGKVLVAGGETAGGSTISSAELYDPATGSFAPLEA